jgi:hypothetical protein
MFEGQGLKDYFGEIVLKKCFTWPIEWYRGTSPTSKRPRGVHFLISEVPL